MPNWCSNNLQITATESEIKEIKEALDKSEGKEFFDIFVPSAEQAGKGEEWYAYNVEVYGFKWNCDTMSWDVDSEGTTITISFDSPWSPPSQLYETLAERYQSVVAYYYEPGMAFCGKFVDGFDETFEIPGSAEEVRESIPTDIDDMFSISEYMEENEWNEDEDES